MRFSSVLLIPLAVASFASATTDQTFSTHADLPTFDAAVSKLASSKHTSTHHATTPANHALQRTVTVTATLKRKTITVTDRLRPKTVTVTDRPQPRTITVTTPGKGKTIIVTAPGKERTVTATASGQSKTITVTASAQRKTITVTDSPNIKTATVTDVPQAKTLTKTVTLFTSSSNNSPYAQHTTSASSNSTASMISNNTTTTNPSNATPVFGTTTNSTNSTNSTATTPNASSGTVVLDYCTLVAAAGNSSLGYYKYQNVRFAAPPTGTLRFAEPAWPTPETGINNGTYAPARVGCSAQEDCLFMDVYAPANSSGKNLPVMVYTFPGGYSYNEKSYSTPEGLFNLTSDFIFVAYNHRLGIMGLASGPTFQHQGGTSNTAVWDAQHAFRWTRKYISAFGGDPNQITAVGFSSGAAQTLSQMTRFGGNAEQLFDRAYVMSPGVAAAGGHYQSEQIWQNLSTSVGCAGGSLDCMRGVSFATLFAAAGAFQANSGYRLQPRLDGNIVADSMAAQLYQGNFNFTGPVVVTHERSEANGTLQAGINTDADVVRYLRIYYPAMTDDVVNGMLVRFPASAYSSPALRFADMRNTFAYTAHDIALTNALNNNTWNALTTLDAAVHGSDQAYYCKTSSSVCLSSSSVTSAKSPIPYKHSIS